MLPKTLRNAKRILAIRLDNIGDVVMLSPALRELKRALPAAHLTLMASAGGSQVVPMLPWVDEVLTWKASWQEIAGRDTGGVEKDRELVEVLKQGTYDAAFIFTSFTQSPYPPAYACYLAGIPVRIGQSKEFGGSLLTQWVRPEHDSTYQVDRNLFLLQAAGVPVVDNRIELRIPAEATVRVETLLAANGLQNGEPYILLAPGASAQARRYPVDRFVQVAELLAEETGQKVLISGSQREEKLLTPFRRAAAQNPSLIWLVGQTSLVETVSLVEHAALVVANNSATLHMAEAFMRPMVIFYSGTEYLTQWSPRHAPALVLNLPVACSPCFAFQCPFDMECLDIRPELVVRKAVRFIRRIAKQTEPAPVRGNLSITRLNS